MSDGQLCTNYTTSKNFNLIFLENQVLKAVAKQIKESHARTDPTLRAQKETEGIFDFNSEVAQIESMMTKMHGGAEPAKTQAVKEKKKKR